MKNEREKSDPSIVAKRPANKPETAEADLWGGWAEPVEPREGTEGNTGEQHTCRTPSRASVTQGLERVREAARKRKKERFTALLHHDNRSAQGRLFLAQAGGGARGGWANVAKLQAEPGSQPSRIAFAHPSGHL